MANPTTFVATGSAKELRLHVAVGPECNNNCLFCMEDDREGRRLTNGALTPEHVRALLESNRDMPEICFTCGEPTLVDALPRYVRWARELGFGRISVSTNGRRLAYAPYCEVLVHAGVNLLYISIHGHTAKLHDGVTRAPGSFVQTLAGLHNAARIASVAVHSCTVVTNRNVGDLAEMVLFLRRAGADQVVFNVMQPNGGADTHFEQLFPRYTTVVDAFAALLATLDDPNSTFLVDVPPCMTETLPAHNRGWVEAYVHHEIPENSPATSALLQRTRTDMETQRRSRGPPCVTCAYGTTCRGVWNNYLARHGWGEFHPVLRR